MEEKKVEQHVTMAGLGLGVEYKEAWHQDIENLAVSSHNVFPSAEDAGKNLDVWDKELKIDDDKTLEQVIKEVALQEGISEDEVRRHLKLFQDSMNAPKSKTKKQKDKAKSKRKMAKKSKKKNR